MFFLQLSDSEFMELDLHCLKQKKGPTSLCLEDSEKPKVSPETDRSAWCHRTNRPSASYTPERPALLSCRCTVTHRCLMLRLSQIQFNFLWDVLWSDPPSVSPGGEIPPLRRNRANLMVMKSAVMSYEHANISH